jgi:hypothetical protein
MAKVDFRGRFQSFKVRVFQAVGFAFLVLMLGCATPEEGIRVSVTQLALPELSSVCSHESTDQEPGLQGCYRWSGMADTGVCRIYILPQWVLDQRSYIDPRTSYHETLGHELHHCLVGHFHGGDKGVDLPRLPRLH